MNGTAPRPLLWLASVTLASGCYCAHTVTRGEDASSPIADAAAEDARGPAEIDAGFPDAGPPPFDCASADARTLLAQLEASASRVGLRLDGEPEGEGTVTSVDAGAITIALDDDREARFVVADPETASRVWAGQSVQVRRDGAWDVLRAGDDVIGVHIAAPGQVGVPPFSPRSRLSPEATFTLDPRCAESLEGCGDGAAGTVFGLEVGLAGITSLYLRPGEHAQRGGIDNWRVSYAGAVELRDVDATCAARNGLHAIVEVYYRMDCIC